MLLGRGERSIFKRKYIKSKTDLFHFLSAARLCHTLIHLSPCAVMHVDSSAPAPARHPWAQVRASLREKKYKNKTKHAEEKRQKTAAASHPRKERRREGGREGGGGGIIKCYVVVLLFEKKKMHSVGGGRQRAALCASGLSRDRCVSTGDHTGVLIRHTDGSVGGAATDA